MTGDGITVKRNFHQNLIVMEKLTVEWVLGFKVSTHWGRVKHIYISVFAVVNFDAPAQTNDFQIERRQVVSLYVGKLTIIGSDNGLSPSRRQAIIWTNAGILLIGPLGTNFSEIVIKIYTFSFKKMHSKMSSGKWRSFCLGLMAVHDQCHACWQMTNHKDEFYRCFSVCSEKPARVIIMNRWNMTQHKKKTRQCRVMHMRRWSVNGSSPFGDNPLWELLAYW